MQSKVIDIAKQYTADALKTASKIEIQKAAEVTGDLIGNKIADKITKVSPQNSPKTVKNETEDMGFDREIPRDIYLQISELLII